MSNVLFVGLKLTTTSREKLLGIFNLEGLTPKADHVTLEFSPREGSEILSWAKSHEGEVHEIKALTWGSDINESGTIEAVGVELSDGVPCKNEHPHITIGLDGTRKPVESNFIERWDSLENLTSEVPVVLEGEVHIWKKEGK